MGKARLSQIDRVVPNDTLIEHLERLLDDAKRGELLGIAYVTAYKGDSVANGWVLGPFGPRRLVGEIEYMNHQIIAKSGGFD